MARMLLGRHLPLSSPFAQSVFTGKIVWTFGRGLVAVANLLPWTSVDLFAITNWLALRTPMILWTDTPVVLSFSPPSLHPLAFGPDVASAVDLPHRDETWESIAVYI